MPGGLLSLFLGLLRADGRRRRFIAGHRRHGVGRRRRFYRGVRDLRRFGGGWNRRRHDAGGCRGPRRHHQNQNGAASVPVQALEPAAQHYAPMELAVHDWLYASPAASMLHVDDDETVAAPLTSPTPAVVEVAGDALAFVSAPTGAPTFVLGSGSGVRSFSNAAAVDAVAPTRFPSPTPAVEYDAVPPFTGRGFAAHGSPAHGSGAAAVDADAAASRLPSPTPATRPPSPRTGARRRLVALGVPLASPLSSSRGRRAGAWSPAALGLANGVAPGTRLPGGSSDEDKRGGHTRLRQ